LNRTLDPRTPCASSARRIGAAAPATYTVAPRRRTLRAKPSIVAAPVESISGTAEKSRT
jgi:hypothetical protein